MGILILKVVCIQNYPKIEKNYQVSSLIKVKDKIFKDNILWNTHNSIVKNKINIFSFILSLTQKFIKIALNIIFKSFLYCLAI